MSVEVISGGSDPRTLGRPNTPLPRTNLSGLVVDHIRSMIFAGTLKADQRVPQDSIAEDLGVSRLPVREALITLESEGLISSEPRRGAFVVPIHAEDVEDHYRIYGMTQGLATRRAAGRLTEPTSNRLRQLVAAMDDNGDSASLHDLNWEFHSLINQSGGSRRLLSVLRQLSKTLPREIYESPPGASPAANEEHRAILRALQTSDSEAADRIAREHVQAEAEYVVHKLRRDGVLTDR
jgi:DNA-binding GntR family transcriptional regulator